jgi:hypothetical protein
MINYNSNYGHSEILNQEEIDQLLTAINDDDTETEPMYKKQTPKNQDFIAIETDKYNFVTIENLDDLSQYLSDRKTPEETYGLYTHDITTLKFFDDKNGEKILADIEQKNKEQ